MGNSDSVIPPRVRDLIKESRKIGGWVERLADHAGDVRAEVVDKVRQDYEDRLQAVNTDLAEHRASLGETLETRRAEVESLRGDRDEHAAELEEAKLRHAVGEFSDSEWKKRKGSVEQTLEDLDALLGVEEKTVSELADIIGRIGASGPQLVVGPAGADDAARPTEGGDAGLSIVDDDAAAEASAPSEAEASAPEDADADAQTPEQQAPEPEDEATAVELAASRADSDAEAEDGDEDEGGEYLDELEFLESLSLGDSDRFDAVSAMLDEDDSGGKASD